MEIRDIKLSSINNREFHNRVIITSSRELVDISENQLLDQTAISLFKKLKQDGKRRNHMKKSKLLNQSYQSNSSTDKSEHRSQKNMFSPPGLNINANLQTNDPFFDSSPGAFSQHQGNQQYQNEEMGYYDEEMNQSTYGNQY